MAMGGARASLHASLYSYRRAHTQLLQLRMQENRSSACSLVEYFAVGQKETHQVCIFPQYHRHFDPGTDLPSHAAPCKACTQREFSFESLCCAAGCDTFKSALGELRSQRREHSKYTLLCML